MPKLSKAQIAAAKVEALTAAIGSISPDHFMSKMFEHYTLDEIFEALIKAKVVGKEQVLRKLIESAGVSFTEAKLLDLIRDSVLQKLDTIQNVFKPVLSAQEAAVLANMSERNLRRYTKPDCYDAPSKHQEFQKACNEVGHRGGVSALPRKTNQQPKLYSRDEVLRWLYGLESTDDLPQLKEENLLLIVQFLSDLMIKATGGKNEH